MCKRHAIYNWRALDEAYNFVFRPDCNWRSAREIMRPESHGSLSCGNFGTPTWESWAKCHLDVAPMESCEEYYKGEGGGFPQVRAMMSLVNPRLPVARPNTKSAQTIH